MLQERSEGFNLERKAENRGNVAFGKGEGQGGRYFHGSQKFGIASAKKLARKVSLDTVPYSDRAMDCSQLSCPICDPILKELEGPTKDRSAYWRHFCKVDIITSTLHNRWGYIQSIQMPQEYIKLHT